MFPYNEILKVVIVKSDLISETNTPKYLWIPNFDQISGGVWELRVSQIQAYASPKIRVMNS